MMSEELAAGGCQPPVLDVCCGSRIFWFDRKDPRAVFVDNRNEMHILSDGRKLEIVPDKVADFTNLPFHDETFYLVVFDPPHMLSLGASSWMAKKYGRLTGDWRAILKAGFEECFRVLRPNGTLVFKWNESDVNVKEVLSLSPCPPCLGKDQEKWQRPFGQHLSSRDSSLTRKGVRPMMKKTKKPPKK